MKLDMRYGNHPEDVRRYDTSDLRRHFLVERIFAGGELNLAYTHVDRVIFGGATPTAAKLELVGGKELGTERFLDRRELGVINIGASGRVILNGKATELSRGDGLYVGMGTAEVAFESADPANPAKFYIVSSPAHQAYPTVKIEQ